MTEKQWIAEGYRMGLVEPDFIDATSFFTMYQQWFRMKSGKIKPESLDRIECTFNRWFVDDIDMLNMACAKMDESYLIDWLSALVIRSGNITEREFGRIYQIVFGVLIYARDMEIKGCKLMDWEKVKRYVPQKYIVHQSKPEKAIPRKDIDALFKAVLVDDIYPLKKSACLCLLANFYLGLRVGELAALEWRNVDFNGRVVYIDKTAVKYFERDEDMMRCVGMSYHVVDGTKTLKSTRSVPMCDEVVYLFTLLKEHHKRMNFDNEYLAYDGNATVLIRSLDRTFRKLCRLCEIPEYNTHKIRKTYATYLHDSGVPLKIISDILGHEDIRTTANFYIKSDIEGESVLSEISDVLKNLVDLQKK